MQPHRPSSRDRTRLPGQSDLVIRATLLVTNSPHLWSPRAYSANPAGLEDGVELSAFCINSPICLSEHLYPICPNPCPPRAFSSSSKWWLYPPRHSGLEPLLSLFHTLHLSANPVGTTFQRVRIQPLFITSTATTLWPRRHHLSPRQHAKHPPT